MSDLERKIEFNYDMYVRGAPKYNERNILDEQTARMIRSGMQIRVADNMYTRMGFVTLGGSRGNCIMPGQVYQVEAVVGSMVKLSEGKGYWGLGWFEKDSIMRR